MTGDPMGAILAGLMFILGALGGYRLAQLQAEGIEAMDRAAGRRP